MLFTACQNSIWFPRYGLFNFRRFGWNVLHSASASASSTLLSKTVIDFMSRRFIVDGSSSDRDSGRRPSFQLRPRCEAASYISNELLADFRELSKGSHLPLAAWNVVFLIDLGMENRMPFTASRNSNWFGFYRTLKIADLGLRNSISRLPSSVSRLPSKFFKVVLACWKHVLACWNFAQLFFIVLSSMHSFPFFEIRIIFRETSILKSVLDLEKFTPACCKGGFFSIFKQLPFVLSCWNFAQLFFIVLSSTVTSNFFLIRNIFRKFIVFRKRFGVRKILVCSL